MDPQDYGIYEDGGEVHSLNTGEYDLPDDGHEPLLLANYFEIKNEKSNQSIFLIEISGKPNIEVDLVAEEDVGTINPILRVFAAIKYLVFGTSLDE